AHKVWQGAKNLVPPCVASAAEPCLRCPQRGPQVPFGIVSEPLQTWLNALRQRKHRSAGAMQELTAGITKANTGLDGIVWNILGQIYVPKSLNEQSFSWHATFPPGTFVPPHIHPTQDEFIYLLDGRLDLMLDGKEFTATTGDLIRMPMNLAHGIFNKSDQTVKCF